MRSPPIFDQAALTSALTELGRRAYAAGRTIEVALYGGSALVLTLDRKVATADVDAVFESDKAFVKTLAAQIARDRGWDENWLNDGVKGWLSGRDSDPDAKPLFRTYPSESEPGLRVFVAKPEYLFAMKCRAMRLGGVEASPDLEDIKMLARVLGLTSSGQALALVEQYYPHNMLEPKTRLGLEEIFASCEFQAKRRSTATDHP